jgi:hypothetical protein
MPAHLSDLYMQNESRGAELNWLPAPKEEVNHDAVQ